MIRHACLCAALTVLPLSVAMIEPALETLLMAAIGVAPLLQASPIAAGSAAIALAAITAGTQEEDRATFLAPTKPQP